MDAIALALVVTGAIVHALWNILAKQGIGGALFVWAYSVASAVLYLPLAVWALVTGAGEWSWPTCIGTCFRLKSSTLRRPGRS